VTTSKRIAGLLGPTLIVVVVSEFPLVQPHLYDAQIPPVVYLSGLAAFVGGLAIVRAHNERRRDWTVPVTLAGWAPSRARLSADRAPSSFTFRRSEAAA
jgi:hypothetical protein